jgi:threonine dehydratase
VVTIEDIRDAEVRLRGIIRHRPAEASSSLSDLVGRPIFAKPEHLQRTGSFKIRGAYNCIRQIADSGKYSDVVAASAGNHAQGVALASRLSGMTSTIFMPQGASLPKLAATRQYGATVHVGGIDLAECLLTAIAYAEASGGIYVPPFDDPMVIAGQGTIGLELVDEVPSAEVIVVPVGGGGLIAGIATAIKTLRPEVRVVGVEAAGAASLLSALAAGHPVSLPEVRTMADGIAVGAVSNLTYSHVEAFVDDVVTVSEEEISRALLVLLERSKWVVEPAGAVALAALLAGKVEGNGPAVPILSGGNVDPLLLRRLIEHGLSAAGRYLILRVVLDDRPGSLANLTEALARLNVNVIEVEHHRSGALVAIAEVEVVMTVETRDASHHDEIITQLCERGFQATVLGERRIALRPASDGARWREGEERRVPPIA